jgi:TPR repeat protein
MSNIIIRFVFLFVVLFPLLSSADDCREFDCSVDLFMKGDDKKAVGYFHRILDDGDYRAALFLGTIYSDLYSDLYDHEQSIKYLSVASDKGSSDSKVMLSMIYKTEAGSSELNGERIKKLLEEAKEDENPLAFLLYAESCLFSEIFKCDVDKAIASLDRAISFGLHEAVALKAFEYMRGKYIDRNYRAAYLHINSLAKEGFPYSQYWMGEFFSKDKNRYGLVEANNAKALMWFELASNQGLDRAKKRYSYLYNNSDASEIKDSLDLVSGYFKQIVESNDPYVKKINNFCLEKSDPLRKCVKRSWVDHFECSFEYKNEHFKEYYKSGRYHKCRSDKLK